MGQVLPPQMGMVLSQESLKANDHNIVIYNKETFSYLPDESAIVKAFKESDPKRMLMDLVFVEKGTGQKFQIINAHNPGDPLKPGRNEFAIYVLTHLKEGCAHIGLGDMNFTGKEMQIAFDEESAKLGIKNPFRNLANYNTNISPFVFTAKGIDHIWVQTDLPCETMRPDEVLLDCYATVDLLTPKEQDLNVLEGEKLEHLRKWYRAQKEKSEQEAKLTASVSV